MRQEQGTPDSELRYRKVAAELREAIIAGEYAAGTKLPPEGTLAERYGVSRGTVRHALAVLRTDGLVTSRRGTRRTVLGGPRAQSFSELLSFTNWARSIGETPGGRVDSVVRRPAEPFEAGRLGLEDGADVHLVLRVRTLSGEPVMVERSLYPARIGELVTELPPDTVSHTEALVAHGVLFTDADHTIDLAWADADDVRLLDCPPGQVLLRERRRTTDPAGAPVEWSEDRYLPGTIAFTVHNSVAASTLGRRHSPRNCRD
ncbi:GntR family transcriptional regulator [Actinacidiphila glaucinigra]|uniref:GntR family transcriptional regulator n=1 Tax=Actinacidiphila glaucinigra TaxID=235986 RepID=UPI002E309D54|nr:GntR family transcriptional regulator [Actinacidiphila glaucinigra]